MLGGLRLQPASRFGLPGGRQAECRAARRPQSEVQAARDSAAEMPRRSPRSEEVCESCDVEAGVSEVCRAKPEPQRKLGSRRGSERTTSGDRSGGIDPIPQPRIRPVRLNAKVQILG
ncbi:hypothetical protein CRENBAI_006924 [Crenichthys baileyi]|uniref:Uncharacterized protein n=1 Tax=Crenichthys baileyi TaxID=28760 RepID=A0AAV9S5S7_9TELE